MSTKLPTVSVNEIFGATIQGEGPDIGRPCYFLRLHHCPVRCPGCFVAGTVIRMADFSTKLIEQVKVGDAVLSYSRKQGRFVPRKVTWVKPDSLVWELYRIDVGANRPTYATAEHPFLVRDRGWVRADKLQVGDRILHLSNSEMKRMHNPMKNLETAAKVSATMKEKGVGPYYYMTPSEIKKNSRRARRRMLLNNPMKDPAVAIKGYLARKDRGHLSRIEEQVLLACEGLGLLFVGGGDLVIGHKVPDFLIAGTNKLIEVWDSSQTKRFRRDAQWCEARASIFKQHGYEVLFLPCIGFSGKNVGTRSEERKESYQQEQHRIHQAVSEFKFNGNIVQNIRRVTPNTAPKVWARLAGDCSTAIPVYNFEVEGTHSYVADGLVAHNCDSFFTWDGSEDGATTPVEQLGVQLIDIFTKNPRCGLVVSGGEPLIHYRNTALAQMLRDVRAKAAWSSLETSGFVGPAAVKQTDLLRQFIHVFNKITISPKITPCLHGEGWSDDELMSNIPNLECSFSYFKFVVRDEADLAAVDKFRPLCNVGDSRIYIMPYGQEPQEILDTCKRIIPWIADRGYTLSPRLHSLLWGRTRGV